MVKKILHLKVISLLIDFAKRIVIPGFDGLSLYEVASFFLKGIYNGYLTTRAASIAFTFFLAIFPAIIFFFTLLPYIPIENIQFVLMDILENLLPLKIFNAVNTTFYDIISRPRGGLLSIGFVMTLFFATNGISGIIDGFNTTYHQTEIRTYFKQRIISIYLVFILSLLLIIGIAFLIFGTAGLRYLVSKGWLESEFVYYLVKTGNWLVILAIFFFTISFIYYLGPTKKTRYRFISAGSTLATLLLVITTVGFNYYLDNFSQYNKLYGSIGTLVGILLWIYFNAISLLIGFELNVSIVSAKERKVSRGLNTKAQRYKENINNIT